MKNTWHQTLQKSLTKETELFESSNDGQVFALRERNLSSIGPGHEALKQVSFYQLFHHLVELNGYQNLLFL